MPCCLLLFVSVLGPRVAILGLALFTAFFEQAFDGLWLLVLGFLFMPFTTLSYAWSINTAGEIAGLRLAVVVFAVLLDLGVIGGGARRRRRRRRAE